MTCYRENGRSLVFHQASLGWNPTLQDQHLRPGVQELILWDTQTRPVIRNLLLTLPTSVDIASLPVLLKTNAQGWRQGRRVSREFWQQWKYAVWDCRGSAVEKNSGKALHSSFQCAAYFLSSVIAVKMWLWILGDIHAFGRGVLQKLPCILEMKWLID